MNISLLSCNLQFKVSKVSKSTKLDLGLQLKVRTRQCTVKAGNKLPLKGDKDGVVKDSDLIIFFAIVLNHIGKLIITIYLGCVPVAECTECTYVQYNTNVPIYSFMSQQWLPVC